MKRFFHIFLILSLFLSCEREPSTVSVTGISVQPATVTLTERETAVLSATVSPADATDKTVTWTSSDPSVASVSDGTVSALREGTAEIRVKTTDGGFQAACRVTVEARTLPLVLDSGQDLKPVFEAKGGTASVSFVTTGPWTADLLGGNAVDWVRIEPARGNAGAATVQFTVPENSTFGERSASVRIQCEDVSETVVITQKQNDDLTVTASKFEVGAEGGTVNIEVKANVDYSYTVNGDWITPLTVRSYESRTLAFTVARNETVGKREGSVTFSGGGFSETVRIYQEGETPTLMLSENQFTIHPRGGGFSVDVRSNVGFSVEMPAEAPWIKNITTRSMSSHTFSFEVEPNPGYYERSARILFTDRDSGLSEAVTVLQEQQEGFILSETSLSLPEKGGAFDVHITSNIAYDFTVEGEWIRIVPGTKGQTEEYTHRFLADPLPSDETYRQARIVFSDKTQDRRGVVTLQQSEDSPVFIQFKDPIVKQDCVYYCDRNGDKELSEREVSLVKDLRSIVLSPNIRSFDEFDRFTGIETIPDHYFYEYSELASISFPSSLKYIGDYAFGKCGKLVSLVFPDGLKEIGNRAFSGTSLEGVLILPPGLEAITGAAFDSCTGLTAVHFPDKLRTIGEGAFWGCTGLSSLSLPESLRELGQSAFGYCSGLTGDLTIPEGVTHIYDQCFDSCTGLNGELTLPSTLAFLGSSAFLDTDFKKVTFRGEIPPECGNRPFHNLKCLIYVPSGSARTYYDSPTWKPYRRIVTEEGHIPSEFYYASTDYSRDGEVFCLQKATKGNGITLVFLGDGYTDKDMAPGGEYETIMRRWMEQFFVYEPYKSFRDWFSIYTVKVVSKHEVYNSIYAERRLSGDSPEADDIGNSISAYFPVIQEYADRAPMSPEEPTRVSVFFNTDEIVGRSVCSYSSHGNFTTLVFDSIDVRPMVLNHEAGGHGFGWLGDEYTEFEQALENPQEILEQSHNWGAYRNLDWRSNPETVLWARFLTDSRYSGEGLGVFEGGMRYSKGIYRPTMNSIMRAYEKGALFSAPSREAIYKNIMRWGVGEDWKYDYEEFVKADEAGRKQASEAYASYPPTRSYVERPDDFEPGLPPILLDDDSVKEIRVSKDGKVTLIR